VNKSKILIEAEPLGNEMVLRLSIDTHLIAENLTPEETGRLVVGILDRIGSVLDPRENAAQLWATEFGRTRRN
jgi:hypothetical protein